MLNYALDRITLHIARLGDDGRAVEGDREHHPRLAKGQVEFVLRQSDVHQFSATAVNDGGDPAFAAQFAGRALAEFGAGLSGDGYLGQRTSP